MNGGTCLSNGLCSCRFGYSGLVCSDKFPIGTIIAVSSNNVLDKLKAGEYKGWWLCDGQNGTPDLRGRVLFGYDKNSNDYSIVGKTGGLSHVSLNVQQLPEHTHTDTGHSHYISLTSSWNGSHEFNYTDYYYQMEQENTNGNGYYYKNWENPINFFYDKDVRNIKINDHRHTVSGTSSNDYAKLTKTGGNQAHENRPPYYVIVYLIFLDK